VSLLLLFLLILLSLVVLAAGGVLLTTLRTGTPPMPTSPVVLATVVAAVRVARDLPADVDPSEAASRRPLLLDGGSGWGTLLVTLSQAFPDFRIEGIERSPVPCLFSRLRLAVSRGLRRLRRTRAHREAERSAGTPRVRCGDLFTARLEDADILLVYLSGQHMERLARDSATLPPVVVSIAFALPGHTPTATLRAPDIYRTPVYVYQMDQP